MRTILLQLFVFILFLGISTVGRAEYFLVYAAGSSPCNTCAERVVYKPCYKKHHKPKHYVRHHRPCNSYRLEVYYYGYVMPCCNSGCRYRCQPVDDFVAFSGQPVSYYPYYYEDTTRSNYYQDQRTADDISSEW